MRIAIIARDFPEASLTLAKYLAKEGVEVDYYKDCGIQSNGIDQGLEYDKVSRWFLYYKKVNNVDIPELACFYKDLPVTLHLIRNSKIYKLIPGLRKYTLHQIVRIIKKQYYDVINIVGGSEVTKYHKALSNEVVYCSVHEVGFHSMNIPSSPGIDYIIKSKTPVHFFSESTRQRFLQLDDADKCMSTVIPFGKFETMLLYDKNIKLNTGLDLTKPTFLFFGHLSSYKGLDVLAKAVELLEDEKGKYNLIIGGRGENASLDFFRQQKNCFVINKMLTNQEINTLNKIASIVVMPYKTASQTGIAPVAFMFGNPIIASRVGALPDVIHDGDNGLLVPPENPVKLASAMKRLIYDRELVNKLTEGTKNYGNNDSYDWKIIAKKTIDFMDKVIKEKYNRKSNF